MAATMRCSCRLHNADAHAVSSAEAGAPSDRDWSRHQVSLRLGPTHRHPRRRRPSAWPAAVASSPWPLAASASWSLAASEPWPRTSGLAPRPVAPQRPRDGPCCSTPSGLRLLLPEARGRQPPRPHSRRPCGRPSQKPPSAASSRPLGLTMIFSRGETVREKDGMDKVV